MLNASRYDEAGSSESSEDENTPILRKTEATSTDKDMEQQKPSADVIKGQTAGSKARIGYKIQRIGYKTNAS